MQEEVENRSVNLAITTTRMTARAKTHKDTELTKSQSKNQISENKRRNNFAY